MYWRRILFSILGVLTIRMKIHIYDNFFSIPFLGAFENFQFYSLLIVSHHFLLGFFKLLFLFTNHRVLVNLRERRCYGALDSNEICQPCFVLFWVWSPSVVSVCFFYDHHPSITWYDSGEWRVQILTYSNGKDIEKKNPNSIRKDLFRQPSC